MGGVLFENPAIAVDSSNNLHVVWDVDDLEHDFTEILYKKSADGGATWTTGKRIAMVAGWFWNPPIVADSSGNLHVVWNDSAPFNAEIYYKKSTDVGATWSASQRLTWTSGGSRYPAIAADSFGNLHVVWQDETPGNSEIYYKKFIK